MWAIKGICFCHFSRILLLAPFLLLLHYRLVGAFRYTTTRSKVPAQNALFSALQVVTTADGH